MHIVCPRGCDVLEAYDGKPVRCAV